VNGAVLLSLYAFVACTGGDLTYMDVRNSGNFFIKLTFGVSILFVGDVFGCS